LHCKRLPVVISSRLYTSATHSMLGSVYVATHSLLGSMWQKDTYAVAVCGSLPAAFCLRHLDVADTKYHFLVCLSLGCPLGWPAGVCSILSMGEQPPSVWATRGPPKVLPMCSRLLERLPADETRGVSPLGCALVAVRACQLVLLCCAHPTKFLTRYLSYPVDPTVVPSVRHMSSTLSSS
jgi:hypothetical protein